MLRFYAVPGWALLKRKKNAPEPERLEPGQLEVELSAVLFHCEYRDSLALERAESLLRQQASPQVYAQPPNDLPALLRTADQLLALSKRELGEKSRIWRCDCGCHYAVPNSLVRPVAIRCDRCGRTLELEVGRSLGGAGAASSNDEASERLSRARLALSEFFREAMARGWPVLVSRE